MKVKKKCLCLILMTIVSSMNTLKSELLFFDPMDYNNGPLAGQGFWEIDPVIGIGGTVIHPGLSYPGLHSNGGAVKTSDESEGSADIKQVAELARIFNQHGTYYVIVLFYLIPNDCENGSDANFSLGRPLHENDSLTLFVGLFNNCNRRPQLLVRNPSGTTFINDPDLMLSPDQTHLFAIRVINQPGLDDVRMIIDPDLALETEPDWDNAYYAVTDLDITGPVDTIVDVNGEGSIVDELRVATTWEEAILAGCSKFSIQAAEDANTVNIVLVTPQDAAGIEMAVQLTDPAAANLLAIEPGPDFPASEDSLIIVNPSTGTSCPQEPANSAWFTIAVVFSQSGAATLPAGSRKVLQLRFSQACANPQAACSVLRFVDCLGPLEAPVRNVVSTPGGEVLCSVTEDGEVCITENFFIRGDANSDGQHDISDPIRILCTLFSGCEALPCLDAADANDDGDVDISDPLYLLFWRFLDHDPPPSPLAMLGDDPTEDSLDCGAYGTACN